MKDLGLTITARNLRRVSDEQTHLDVLCVDVSYYDRSESAYTVYRSDWQLQQPAGYTDPAVSPGLTDPYGTSASSGSTLLETRLSVGESVAGTVCFPNPNQAGRYVLIWKPADNPFNSDRGIWFFHL